MSNKISNKWQKGPARFEIPRLDPYLGNSDGFIPLPMALDLGIGEEVVLIVRDQTPFMEELCKVRPFRLLMKCGSGRNEFGPLIFMLFWVEDPSDPTQHFAAWDCYLDPKSESWMRVWRVLALQTHWHLLLVDKNGRQRGFFEFENNYGLDETLDFCGEACRGITTVDFNQAKFRFMKENSIDDLFAMT